VQSVTSSVVWVNLYHCKRGKTSLMVAAEHGQLDIVHYLVDRGASIEAVDVVCETNV
jgi:hypothetical protein